MSGSSLDDRSPEVIALLVPFFIIPVIAIALRIWSRFLIHNADNTRLRGLWWDDWLLLLDLAFSLTANALVMSWTNYGLGKHITRVSPPDLEKGLLTLWIVLWLYFTGLWLSKLSAIAFYARIFGLGNKNKKYRAALWVVVGLLNVWMIGLILSLLLQCRPLHKSWERKIPGECYDYYLWWLSSTLSNFLLDMIVLLLPLPMLWRLQIDRSKKKYIYCVFITGYSVICVSLGRLILQLYNRPLDGHPYLPDFTYDLIRGGKWLMAESPVAILSLSLPAIYALVRKGMKDGPHALFRSRQTVSNIGGTMILRRGSTSMEPLKDDSSLPKHKVSAEYHAIAFGEPALDSSRKKGWIGTSDRGIYVQTEIKIETEPKWLELTGVDV